jgi:hypothetical protein
MIQDRAKNHSQFRKKLLLRYDSSMVQYDYEFFSYTVINKAFQNDSKTTRGGLAYKSMSVLERNQTEKFFGISG